MKWSIVNTLAISSAAFPLGQRMIGTHPRVTKTENKLSAMVLVMSFMSVSLASARFKAELDLKLERKYYCELLNRE